MPSVNPPSPLPAGGDDRFHFSPGNANPELWATTTPLVVVHRCKRHKGLIATWRAIHWLIVLHSRSGRADFGVREIAEEADVGRNELCDTHDAATGQIVKKGYISILSDAGLIDIVGQVAVPGGRKPRNIYSVNLARLIAESALLAPEVLRTYGAAAPPRPQVHPDQLTFFSLMEREADKLRHNIGPVDRLSQHPVGLVEVGLELERRGLSTAADRLRPQSGPGAVTDQIDCPENGTDGRLQSSSTPENGTASNPIRPVSGTAVAAPTADWPENGTVRERSCPENGTEATLACPENGLVRDEQRPLRPGSGPEIAHQPHPYHPHGTLDFGDRPENGTAAAARVSTPTDIDIKRPEIGTKHSSTLSRFRDVGGMDGGMEGWGDGGWAFSEASLTRSQVAVREIVRVEIQQALKELLDSALLPPPIAQTAPVTVPVQEDVPPTPKDELPIEAGPELTWATLIDRELTEAERSKIRELVRRYAGPSQGTAAYWLVRAMNTVALDDKPLTLNYVGGVLKRLKRTGRWDSEELTLAAGETRVESNPEASSLRAPASPPSTRGKEAESRAGLPPDLCEAPAVQIYLSHAPKGIALAESWAREILRRVRDLGLWESNCQNWRAKYDYSNVRGLLERHETDIRAIRTPVAAGGHEAPVDPLAAIYQRLSLTEQERITAIADAIEERHHLDREGWTWVLVALSDGQPPEDVEREAVSRFTRTARPGDGGRS